MEILVLLKASSEQQKLSLRRTIKVKKRVTIITIIMIIIVMIMREVAKEDQGTHLVNISLRKRSSIIFSWLGCNRIKTTSKA